MYLTPKRHQRGRLLGLYHCSLTLLALVAMGILGREWKVMMVEIKSQDRGENIEHMDIGI